MLFICREWGAFPDMSQDVTVLEVPGGITFPDPGFPQQSQVPGSRQRFRTISTTLLSEVLLVPRRFCLCSAGQLHGRGAHLGRNNAESLAFCFRMSTGGEGMEHTVDHHFSQIFIDFHRFCHRFSQILSHCRQSRIFGV